MRFAPEFGFQYLVLPSQNMVTATVDFNFPVAYENPYYIVYKLESSTWDGSGNP
jgi:hypothetical protein